MKSLLLATTLATIVLGSALPVTAMTKAAGLYDAALLSGDYDKRRKLRVPGGSGCDDPGDIIEHPACRPVTP